MMVGGIDDQHVSAEFRLFFVDHVSAIINLGNVSSQKGELAEAERRYRQALAIEPNHSGALASLAKVAVSRGDMRTAISYLEQSIEQDPRRAEAHYVLAQLLRSQNRAPEALASFRRAVDLAPQRGDIHFDVALAYAHEGRFADSWRHVHEAERFGWAPPPEFLTALRAQMPDPG